MPEVSQRLALYKQLSGARDDDELGALRGELLDRYGPLPVEAREPGRGDPAQDPAAAGSAWSRSR